MNATPLAAEPEPGKIISLPTAPRQPSKTIVRGRYSIKEFTNASGTKSWRVDGYKLNGERVRINYADETKARAKHIELETEFLKGKPTPAVIQATHLTETQIKIAESCYLRLGFGNDADMLRAVDHWLIQGKQNAVKETVRLDEAFTHFKEWLEKQPEIEISHDTKKNLRNRVNIFCNSVPNMLLSTIDPDTIAAYLDKRNVSRQTKTNDRLALSRFFGWCREVPRKWIAQNPARKENKSRRPARPEPQVLSVEECIRLMSCAEKFKAGRLVPFFAVCMFGGLRPLSEARRLEWSRINIADGEITISSQNKTKRGRTIKMSDTLRAWLEPYKNKPFYPSNFRKDFDKVRFNAGFGTPNPECEERKDLKPWPEDAMRHSAISHYFRNCGSYGLTAEWAGNSEQVIKNHYQGKVSTEDTKRFYSIMPTKKGNRK